MESYKNKSEKPAFHQKFFDLNREKQLGIEAVALESDPLRLVVRHQLMLSLDKPLNRTAKDISVYETKLGKADEHEKKIRIRRVCHCNPNLVLIEGEDIHLLTGDLSLNYSPGTDDTPPTIKASSANDIHYSPGTDDTPPAIKASSSGDDTTTSRGLPVDFNQQLRRIYAASDLLSHYPSVAVMDTGIDFGYPNTANLPTMYTGGVPICNTMESDFIGWDFIHNHNYPYDDNDRNKHGSRIAAIISQVAGGRVRILPLKVIDSEGIGILFNIMCGFEYLLSERMKGRVKIINASWGFYSNQPDPLLKTYIERLRNAGIWLINAAGNQGDIIDGQIINLDDYPRYPANYSDTYPSVVTVTTVANSVPTVKVAENFSPTTVNVGIGAGPDGKFKEPLATGDFPQIKGSSYATPYVSGMVVALHLNATTAGPMQLIKALPKNTKNKQLLNKIKQEALVVSETK